MESYEFIKKRYIEFRNYLFNRRLRKAVEYINSRGDRLNTYELMEKINKPNVEDLALPDTFARQVRSIRTGELFEDD